MADRTLHLAVGWMYDEQAHEAARDEWRNFWSLYVEELLKRLGFLMPVQIHRADLARHLGPPELSLSGVLRALVIPRGVDGGLRDEEIAAIGEWVSAGGVAICFATPGAEKLAGGEIVAEVEQPGDEFSVTAVMEYVGRGRQWTGLTAEENVRSPVVSPLRVITAPGAETLAILRRPDGGEAIGPGVSLARVGNGLVAYWAFDLAQCAWAVMQGRPVYFDRDGDGYMRTVDAIVIGDHDLGYPHVDLMGMILRELVGVAGVPLADPLPPLEGRPADCLVYIGGDEEGAKGTANWASRWMARRGLPYHVNIMPDAEGNFACSPAEVEEIRSRGHEVSLHFNFMDGFAHPSPFTEEDIRRQVGWFQDRFGFVPTTVVMHWVRWTGWAEPAQWMEGCGIRGDNSRLHVPGLNPRDRYGYAFGTAMPYRAWTDWHDGNRRLRFVFQPITAYETGYWTDDETNDFTRLEQALGNARRWRTMVNLFYHSVNITWHPSCRRAIEHAARWLEERRVRALLCGNDWLTEWWFEREAVELVPWLREKDGLVEVIVHAPGPRGVVVWLPRGWQPAPKTADEQELVAAGELWGQWQLVALPHGVSHLWLRPEE